MCFIIQRMQQQQIAQIIGTNNAENSSIPTLYAIGLLLKNGSSSVYIFLEKSKAPATINEKKNANEVVHNETDFMPKILRSFVKAMNNIPIKGMIVIVVAIGNPNIIQKSR